MLVGSCNKCQINIPQKHPLSSLSDTQVFAIFHKTEESTLVTYREFQRQWSSPSTGLPSAPQSTHRSNTPPDVWLCIVFFHQFSCGQLIKMWSLLSLFFYSLAKLSHSTCPAVPLLSFHAVKKHVLLQLAQLAAPMSFSPISSISFAISGSLLQQVSPIFLLQAMPSPS